MRDHQRTCLNKKPTDNNGAEPRCESKTRGQANIADQSQNHHHMPQAMAATAIT